MNRLVATLLTCAVAVTLAVGIVTALTATPEQANVPSVSFPEGQPSSSAS